MPHPGFPTDMQSQMMALMMTAHGTGIITETVFENRFMHVEEFRRMNGNIKIEGSSVIMESPSNLQGAEVGATDLRAAAALFIAGLVAEGITRVTELYHLDRGYVDFDKKLAALGADIERIGTESSEKAISISIIIYVKRYTCIYVYSAFLCLMYDLLRIKEALTLGKVLFVMQLVFSNIILCETKHAVKETNYISSATNPLSNTTNT